MGAAHSSDGAPRDHSGSMGIKGNGTMSKQMMEACEPRRLMADATAVLDNNGTLVVTGTSGADKLDLSQITRSKGSEAFIQVKWTADGKRTQIGEFDRDDVKRIEVRAGAKKDSVVVNLYQQRIATSAEGVNDIPIFVDGGQGNDDLRVNHGRATVQGGAGDDVIASRVPGTVRLITDDKKRRGGPIVTFYPVGNFGLASWPSVIQTVADRWNVTSVGDQVLTTDVTSGEPFRGVVSAPLNGRLVLDATYNRLDGGDGNDTIASSGGDDTVVGGAGEDRFVPLYANVETRFGNLPTITTTAKEVASRAALFGIELIKGEEAAEITGIVTAAGPVSVRASSLVVM